MGLGSPLESSPASDLHPNHEPRNVPISTAHETAAHVPVGSTAWTDGFIDDLIMVTLNMEGKNARESRSVLLAIHITSRPHSGSNKPITHWGILSNAKLIAKGTPA
jgi:hypothetical protein